MQMSNASDQQLVSYQINTSSGIKIIQVPLFQNVTCSKFCIVSLLKLLHNFTNHTSCGCSLGTRQVSEPDPVWFRD